MQTLTKDNTFSGTLIASYTHETPLLHPFPKKRRYSEVDFEGPDHYLHQNKRLKQNSHFCCSSQAIEELSTEETHSQNGETLDEIDILCSDLYP